MKRFFRGRRAEKIRFAVTELLKLDIPLRAAYAGFFIVLSMFPALLLVLACVRLTGIQVEALMELIAEVIPAALMDTVRPMVYQSYWAASGAMAGLSAVMALWSASKGVYGLLVGMDAVYGVSETRGYFITRAISVLYSLAFLLVLLLTLVLHVFGSWLSALLRSYNAPVLNAVLDVLDLRFFILTAIQSLLFTVMFMVLPNRRNGFWASLPGGLLSSIGWLVFSDLYSIYVENFAKYANIFGSVYGIALSMLWLYFCISILFYGGALNRYLAEKR